MNPAVLIFFHESIRMYYWENCRAVIRKQLRNTNALFLLFTHSGGVWIIVGHRIESPKTPILNSF